MLSVRRSSYTVDAKFYAGLPFTLGKDYLFISPPQLCPGRLPEIDNLLARDAQLLGDLKII